MSDNPNIEFGELKDERDGKTYKTVKIGEQVWMAENLNFEAEGSECYDNKPENCEKYGRLYDWETAMKACPAGWHLPTNAEWDALCRYVDGTSGAESPYASPTAGKHLKAKGGWNSNGNGTDDFGFAALPGGYCLPDDYFYGAGNYGNWWSASESDRYYAYSRDMYYIYENANWYNYNKTRMYSVRCVMDREQDLNKED